VADVAHDHGAEVTDLGTMGTRQYDRDHLTRTLQSKANQLVFVDAVGPCGDWLYRYLTKQGASLLGRRALPLSQEGGRPREHRPS
jgi:hypothetical protein